MEEVVFLVATFKIRSMYSAFFRKEKNTPESSHLLSPLPGAGGIPHTTCDPYTSLEELSQLGGRRGQGLARLTLAIHRY